MTQRGDWERDGGSERALEEASESGEFDGTAFNVGTATLYEQLYYKITEGKPMDVTPEMASDIIGIIEQAHAENPMDIKF